MPSFIAAHSARLQFEFLEAEFVANTPLEAVAPIDGFIQGLDSICEKALTTGGSIAVYNWTSGAAVQVAGLVNQYPNSAAKGSRPTANVPATVGSSTRAVKAGDRLQIVPIGFATAGRVGGFLTFTTLDRGGMSLQGT